MGTAKQLFLDALELPPGERAAFVAGADAPEELKQEVRELLVAEESAGDFLGQVTAEVRAAQPSPATSEWLAGMQVGPFTLCELLGAGGFGEVWLAQQQQPVARQVALKLLRPGLATAELRARFAAERDTLARLGHNHIARVLDAGAGGDGQPYIAIEYVDGPTIAAWCQRPGVDLEIRVRLLAAVCRAVAHAHDKAIIHRDIKPANVLVATEDGQPVPKVIDFGIAKLLEADAGEGQTMEGQLIGTPVYLSPEQIEQGSAVADVRSDVYALGVLLFELLTGEPPIDPASLRGLGTTAMLHRLARHEHRAPSRAIADGALARRVAGDLDLVTLKALERDPERRYRSAHELAEDLERFLRHEPVHAVPPTASYRLRKFVRRHRLAVGAAAALLLVGIAGLVGVLWQAAEARRERDEARRAEQRESQAKQRADGLRLGAAALNELSRDPGLALLLAMQGAARAPGLASRTVLYRILPRLRELGVSAAHDSYLVQLAFAPDAGGGFCSGGDDGLILLHAADGTVRQRIDQHFRPGNQARGLTMLAFDAGGTQLVSAATDRWLRVWDPGSGRQLAAWQHPGAVMDGALSPDGRWATACADGFVRVGRGGEPTQELGGHRDGVHQVVWLDDTCLLTRSGSGAVRIWWPAQARHEVLMPGEVRAIARSGTRGPVGLCGRDWIRFYRRSAGATAGLEFRSELRRPGFELRIAAVHPQQDRVYLHWSDERGSQEHRSEVLRLAAGGEDELQPLQTRQRLRRARWSPQGDMLALAQAESHEVLVFDHGQASPRLHLAGHRYDLACLAWSKDGLRLLSGAKDLSVRLWDTSRRTPVHRPDEPVHSNWARALSADGQLLVKGDCQGRHWTGLSVHDLSRDSAGRALAADGSRYGEACIDRQRRRVAAQGADGRVRIWDLASGQVLQRLETGVDQAAIHTSLRFDPSGRRLLWRPPEGRLALFDLAEGTSVALGAPGGRATGTAFSPDGELIAICEGRERRASLWTSKGELLRELPRSSGWSIDAVFAPSGDSLAVSFTDTTVKIFATATGETLQQVDGIPRQECSLDFAPDGSLLLVRARTEVLLVDPRDAVIRARIPLANPCRRAGFGPGGEGVWTAGIRGSVQSWPVDVLAAAARRATRPLEQKEWVLFAVGDQEAWDAYAADLPPRPERARDHRSHGYRSLGQGQLREAVEHFQRALSLRRYEWDCLLGAGHAYGGLMAQGQLGPAQQTRALEVLQRMRQLGASMADLESVPAFRSLKKIPGYDSLR